MGAQIAINNSYQLGCEDVVGARDICQGNDKVNSIFVAEIFAHQNGLPEEPKADKESRKPCAQFERGEARRNELSKSPRGAEYEGRDLAVGVAMLHLISLHPEKTQILQHSEDIVNKYIDGLPSKVYRTGGGYAMSLQEYLKHRGPVECIKILKSEHGVEEMFQNKVDEHIQEEDKRQGRYDRE